jgi:hypothetical protein
MSMTPDALFDQMVSGFPRRKFSAGLLVAFIDFLTALEVPGTGLMTFDSFLQQFERQTTTAAGATANTLIVKTGDGRTLSLRPFYNAVERYYRAEHKRFDYPSADPHATQAWADYRDWLDALVTFSPDELINLRSRVNQFVLDTLKSQAFDPATIDVEPPLFRLILAGFAMTAQPGEPTGAPFQGIVFGFLRADNPHLQIEIDKVRTGSKRLQRVGDVDGWEGARLAISAEVKQYTLTLDNTHDLEAFGNSAGRQGALGIVAALGFNDGVREKLAAMGLIPLDKADLLRIVELWDPVKQRTAVSSFVYYARHVEKNFSLIERVEAFITIAGEEWRAARHSAISLEAVSD